MDNKYQQFRTQVYGQFIEREDASNYAQCLDLAFAWCDALGIPRETIRHLYAYQAFTQPLDVTKKYFDLIPNGPTNTPAVGALVVFDTKVGIAGHISIETGKSTSKDLFTLDQNWGNPKSVREVVHNDYFGCLGWLQPKTQLSPDDQVIAKVRTIIDSATTSTDKRAQIKQII